MVCFDVVLVSFDCMCCVIVIGSSCVLLFVVLFVVIVMLVFRVVCGSLWLCCILLC